MAKKNKLLQFGLIGCGRIGRRHAELLSSQVTGAKLVAVCDINLEKSKDFGEKHSVPFYEDMAELLNRKDVDVVCVCTPSGLHANHAIRVAKAGKHVVVEKPMALKLEDAEEMMSECDKAKVRLFIVKQNRFNVPIMKLREALEADRFGKLVLGTVRVRWCRKQDYYDMDEWRGTWALDGGVFTNQASHHIDMLEWMLGDIVSVFAKTRTQLVNIETEDTGVAVLHFKNGALGIIEATTATRPTDLEGSISILGEKGSVVIGGFAMNEILTWNFNPPLPDDEKTLKTARENPPDVYGFGHKRYLEHVVECINNNSSALVAGPEAFRSIEVINALYESAESGKEVHLRFRPERSRLGK